MKLWMSCEAMIELAESFRIVRGKLEKAINHDLENFMSESGFTKWAVIAIIRPDNHPDYQEVVKINRKSKVIECRLKVDYRKYLEGDERERTILLAEMLLKSLSEMKQIPIAESELTFLSMIVSRYANPN